MSTTAKVEILPLLRGTIKFAPSQVRIVISATFFLEPCDFSSGTTLTVGSDESEAKLTEPLSSGEVEVAERSLRTDLGTEPTETTESET